MVARIIASVAAVAGGGGWVSKVVLIWANDGSTTDEGTIALAYLGGLAALAVSLAAGGYLLVEKAPIWLRLVVAAAVPLLVLVVWQLVDDGIKAVYTSEGWLRDEAAVLLGGTVALLMGLWGFTRVRPDRPGRTDRPEPLRGRRAAR